MAHPSLIHISAALSSILNHTLKNTMTDAAADIEMFLINTDLPEPAIRHLSLSMATLRRGMRACRHRQAYINKESGGYQPSLQPVQLGTLVDEVTAGLVVMRFTCKLISLCQEPSMCESFLTSLTSHS